MKKLLFLLVFIPLVFACSNESVDDENNQSNNLNLIGVYELIHADEDGVVFYDGSEGCPDIIEFTSNSVIWEYVDNDECTDYNSTTGSYLISNNSESMVEGSLSDNFFFEAGDDDYVGTFFYLNLTNLTVEVHFDNGYIVTYSFILIN